MDTRLRVGVVGCGVIAQVMHLPHLAELDDRFELAAVCDVDEAVARACAARYAPAAQVFTSWEELVAERLDVVMVLTSGSHAPMAVAAAQAGSHVFVEKPMALSVDEGREMLEAARAADVRLMVGTMKRYDPAYERLLELLPQELRLVRATTLESPFEPYVQAYPLTPPPSPPADVIGALKADDAARLLAAMPEGDDELRFCYRYMLLDNLVHELNMLRGALGEPDAVIRARLSRTVCDIALAFGDAEVHLSWVDLPGMARYKQEVAFYGLDRRVTLTLPSPYLRAMPSRIDVEGGEAGSPHAWQKTEVISYEEAFKRELFELDAAIREHRDPRTDGIDGLHDVALCASIAKSARTGQPVERPTELPAWASATAPATAEVA